jgi:hypothetical protein
MPNPGVPPPPGSEWEQAPGGQAGYVDTDPSALVDFRDALDPYGNWVDDPTYGTVWVPSPAAIGPNFAPYVTAGHWTYDNGWTWVSDYPWGWATFHYGRWVSIPGDGWAWVPGRTYSGAWVDWRVGDGYVGWAPQPPSWGWRNGIAVRLGSRPGPPFTFSRQNDLFSPDLRQRVFGGPGYVNHTRPYAQVAPPAYRGPANAGPAPAALGIPPSRLVRPSSEDVGLRQARRLAVPVERRPVPSTSSPGARPNPAQSSPPPARRVR